MFRFRLGTRLLTGMPEFVLIPAPVMTTTLRAFQRELAMSWSSGAEPGSTWVVGMAATAAVVVT